MAKTQPLYTEPHIDYSDSQVLPSDNGLYVDPEYPETCPPMEGLHRLILEFGMGVEGSCILYKLKF